MMINEGTSSSCSGGFQTPLKKNLEVKQATSNSPLEHNLYKTLPLQKRRSTMNVQKLAESGSSVNMRR